MSLRIVKWAISHYRIIPLDPDHWTVEQTANLCDQGPFYGVGVLRTSPSRSVLVNYHLGTSVIFSLPEA